MRTMLLLLVFSTLLTGVIGGMAFGEEIAVLVDLPEESEYQVIDYQAGQRIGFEGCGYRDAPGSPMLPTKTFLVALPPGGRVTGLDIFSAESFELPGTVKLAKSPEPVPIADGMGLHRAEAGRHASSEIIRREEHTGEIDAAGRAWISATGSLGPYRYAAVTLCPCAYCPDSGKLTCYRSAEITLTCEVLAPGRSDRTEACCLSSSSSPDMRARDLLINFDAVRDLYYRGAQQASSPLQTYDYVIITTSGLSGAVTSSNFITWKTSLGYSVKIVLVTDPEIAGQPGDDLAEQIRNFLRAYQAVWDIEYVLMVGNYSTIPMRYCYPDPTNHTNTAGTPGGSGGEVPTDYYYADLSDADSVSWDSDGDGYYGEYGEDSPDFMPEVYVGRIPVTNTARITYALNKTVTFEQDTGAWKQNALHAGAFWYFTHERSDTSPCMDAAKYLSYIESDIMTGWTITHYSEQSGLEVSAYPWPALTEAAFAGSWRTGQHAVVNWGAHGWTDCIARKVWDWDDGDGIPEGNEISWPGMLSTTSNLDDDYPSVVTSASCLVGCPEPSAWDRLGIKMLTLQDWGPAVGVIASARSPYGTAYWPPGGSESIIYEFNDLMINGHEKVGQAFYDSKFYCNTNYGWDHYAEYINMYTFNLWGDPSLTLEGVDLAGIDPKAGDEGMRGAIRLAAGPSPARGPVTITYDLASAGCEPRLSVFDVLGRRVCSLDAPAGTGRHEIEWDGLKADGAPLPSGVYWIRLAMSGKSRAVRILLIR